MCGGKIGGNTVLYFIMFCELKFRTNILDHISDNLHKSFASVLEDSVGE